MRYNCRQNLANQRFRHQGRFIKKEELEKFDLNEIYDPRRGTRYKQIFRVTRVEPISASMSVTSAFNQSKAELDEKINSLGDDGFVGPDQLVKKDLEIIKEFGNGRLPKDTAQD